LDLGGKTETINTLSLAMGSGGSADVQTGGVTGAVATGTSATQFAASASTSLSAADGFYVGSKLRFTSGARNGEVQIVTGYVGATRTFTFATGFSGTPQANDAFSIDGTLTLVNDPTTSGS